MKRRKGNALIILLSLIGIIAAAAVGPVYGQGEFLFLDEIEPGMRGIGKTIIAGDEIREFTVEVLGVIDNPGGEADFIVVRVSGEVIGLSGGIAQGMSGSPIYIDGKLIGALSRAAAWAKVITPVGLVTPIEQMLEVIAALPGGRAASEPAKGAVLAGVTLVEVDAPPSLATIAGAPDTIFAHPVIAPLLVTGLAGRSLDMLMDGIGIEEGPAGLLREFLPLSIPSSMRGLSSFGLRLAPFAGGTGGATSPRPPLQPGSSIGVALTRGDVTIGALGTLTYIEGNTLVGFGHPFLSGGRIAFPLTNVHIYTTIAAFDISFKIGSLRESIGTILEDRMAGVGGIIGKETDLVDLSFGVVDLDRNITRNFQIEVVDEPRLMGTLLLSTGFAAIDATLDRIGQGTVEVTYRIIGDGMPFPLERRDIFISTNDIAVYPPWQLAGIVSFLQYNDFADPKITRITASMQITQELNAMRINRLVLDQDFYYPGDTIHYTVELQTFRGETRVVEGTIDIPDGLLGDSIIVVRAYSGPRLVEEGETPIVFESLADIIERIEGLPSHDTLTVELFAWDYIRDGLRGIGRVRTEFTGYFLYAELEVEVPLFMPED